MLATIGSIDPIELTLLDAQGLLLAEQVLADAPLPGFDNAATDGYAVRAVDLKEATRTSRWCCRWSVTSWPAPVRCRAWGPACACGS